MEQNLQSLEMLKDWKRAAKQKGANQPIGREADSYTNSRCTLTFLSAESATLGVTRTKVQPNQTKKSAALSSATRNCPVEYGNTGRT